MIQQHAGAREPTAVDGEQQRGLPGRPQRVRVGAVVQQEFNVPTGKGKGLAPIVKTSTIELRRSIESSILASESWYHESRRRFMINSSGAGRM